MEDYTQIICEGCSKESGRTLNITRFIEKLDQLLGKNDLPGARRLLLFWEDEARLCKDKRGLLTVLNEEIGFSRRTGDEEMAFSAVSEAEELLEETDCENNFSGAIVLTNMATTLSAFGKASESLPVYEKAKALYELLGMQSSFEYASLLNNMAEAFTLLDKYGEGEKLIRNAIDILKEEGRHDGEIAVSYVNLAHLIYDRNENDTDMVESMLDLAEEHLDSPRQEHDANYAYILSKCAPSFMYFLREERAKNMKRESDEIYGKKREKAE